MRGHGKNGHGRLAAAALRCQPDSRLVDLVREGHDSAFAEIVRRYRAPLVTYAGGIVPDHHAEDVVQEALTRAHSALGRSDAEMNIRPWLFTIVRNGALNALRHEPVHGHLDENYDGVPQPPEVAARREELAALTASVKGLPDQQREALVKRELEGRSHDEIAASLGLSAGAVRGLIYRARAALRNGAGMLIPLPVLRALLGSGTASPEATGAAGAAAAGLAGGGGGVALKAGATLGVAVIAVGSGIAVQHRDSGPKDPASSASPSRSARAHGGDGPGGVRLAEAAPSGGRGSADEGRGSTSSGPGGGRDASSGSGEHSGGGSSSGPGPGTGGDDGGHSGSGSGGADGGSNSGPGGGGDDGGSSTSGGGGGGSSGPGGGDSTSGSSDDGGSGSSGSGSTGSGSGDDGGTTTATTTTTSTTTTTDGSGGGTSGGSD